MKSDKCEEFWAAVQKNVFNPDVLSVAADEMDALLGLVRFKPRARVLDMPCGVGRHSVVLAERGFRVTGVDIVQDFIDRAEKNARAGRGSGATFLRADMRDFIKDGFFDMVINMYDSFGYFAKQEDDGLVLQNVYKSLKPGGAFILETTPKEVIAALMPRFSRREWREDNGTLCLMEKDIVENWSKFRFRWLTIDKNTEAPGNSCSIREDIFERRLYSAVELEQALKKAGFSRIELYGGYNKVSFNNLSEKLVAVAHKQES